MHTRKSKTIFFVLEGLNALATSYFNSYVFFLLRDRFGFGNLGNLSASALGGFVYMFAAWQGGRFAQRFGYFTALKTGFGGLAVCLALGVLVPSLPAVLLVFVGWTATVCFTWPTLEALVSDGVSDDILPKNIGIYNVVWSAGMASMYFIGGTLYETLGHDSIFWLPALIHGGLCLIVLRLGKNPVHTAPAAPPAVAPHPLEAAAFTQPVSPQTFLRMVWLAIPFSYIGITTVIAIIPALAKTLGLSTAQAGLFCSIWMFVRLGTFVALWQWTGWHYRFRWLVGAFVGLTAGFSLLLLSHQPRTARRRASGLRRLGRPDLLLVAVLLDGRRRNQGRTRRIARGDDRRRHVLGAGGGRPEPLPRARFPERRRLYRHRAAGLWTGRLDRPARAAGGVNFLRGWATSIFFLRRHGLSSSWVRVIIFRRWWAPGVDRGTAVRGSPPGE